MNVCHAGMIGHDGTFLEKTLKQSGVDIKYLKKSEPVRTGNAIIQNNRQGDNCIILYGGANQEITKGFVDTVLREFASEDWLVLQNEIK